MQNASLKATSVSRGSILLDAGSAPNQCRFQMRPAVVCFSGKRKSGKDFICALLAERLTSEGLEVAIRGVSYPLKEEYAMLNNLDAELLKSDATYKEIYRQKMVEWGENIRRKDPAYFCRLL
uniref:Phosphomevalonate kinase n=1 Tax=Parascaris equorum TaxID=6256 RepID=A0A914RWJ1_PAREQ